MILYLKPTPYLFAVLWRPKALADPVGFYREPGALVLSLGRLGVCLERLPRGGWGC